MTPKELYEWAQARKLEEAHIRICDGMAITMYPEMECVSAGRYQVIISALERERTHRLTGASLPETIFCIRT